MFSGNNIYYARNIVFDSSKSIMMQSNWIVILESGWIVIFREFWTIFFKQLFHVLNLSEILALFLEKPFKKEDQTPQFSSWNMIFHFFWKSF